MFFDGTLLAIGNIMFLGGLVLLIGMQATIRFFSRREKIRGTLLFFFGVTLVFFKFAKLGILVEILGGLSLFGQFLPNVVAFLRKMPFIGPVLSAPGITRVVDKLSGHQFPV